MLLEKSDLQSWTSALVRKVMWIGAFYALLSLGLAVIFGLMNVINFTHGAQYMMGAFCAWMLLNYLGIPEELLWGSVLVFVAALAGGAVLLSETVRWRIKRFIARHFYRTKYDYREQ